MLLYIDQPTLGVLNFGFIKYVCILEPALYLRNPLYIFPAFGHKTISKKLKSFALLICPFLPQTPFPDSYYALVRREYFLEIWLRKTLKSNKN